LLAKAAKRTEHQRAQWGADVRQGEPDPDTVHTEESDLPEGLSRERMGPLDKNTGHEGGRHSEYMVKNDVKAQPQTDCKREQRHTGKDSGDALDTNRVLM
jgi:hypothetical protein